MRRIERIYHDLPDRIVLHSNARQRRAWNFWLTVGWIFPGALIWFVLRNDLWFVGFLSIWALWISHWTAFAAETPFEDEHEALDQAFAARTEQVLTHIDEMLVERTKLFANMVARDETFRILLEGLERTLSNQQDMIDVLTRLSKRDVAVGDHLEEMIGRIGAIQVETAERHKENQKLLKRGVERDHKQMRDLIERLDRLLPGRA
jgi:hypothetical protein